MAIDNIPDEFMKFTEFFHQDFDKFFPDGEGFIEDALANTPPNDRIVIKNYLEELLSNKYDEQERRLIWRSTRAHISPFRGNEGSCTEFFKYLLPLFVEDK